MKVKILREAGYTEAMLGLSLAYHTDITKMPLVARRLAPKDGGHNKFMESVVVWVDITAPRYFWVDFDAYRIGITKQSQASWNQVTRRPLTQDDFASPILSATLEQLKTLYEKKQFRQLKAELPEGFLQRRIVCLNYKALRHIIGQRHNHRMQEWHHFCNRVVAQASHPEFLMK